MAIAVQDQVQTAYSILILLSQIASVIFEVVQEIVVHVHHTVPVGAVNASISMVGAVESAVEEMYTVISFHQEVF